MFGANKGNLVDDKDNKSTYDVDTSIFKEDVKAYP